MSCDLGRLRLAIDTALEERGAEERFQLRLHRYEVEDPPPPDQTDDEMAASALSVMQMLWRQSDEDE
ncbi:hypothetical protein [Aureimonas sp. SK2]|uniref:hypothetical protein n=1 Tax=Aureimonas sp. SK2 TaxID=3015992 RepID=UPI0024442A7E|nr:hypothetical protein [Aureimonas sp. SK2]